MDLKLLFSRRQVEESELTSDPRKQIARSLICDRSPECDEGFPSPLGNSHAML
ncbi:hypothetical protein VQ042_19200 [Aurantimonas sp. A2-1-M11]|uniref:hypothetical protein n=1 Tax=Aurantimonas sp. A2-1-M11 TaxID=3113712 RepID=UPI002F927389